MTWSDIFVAAAVAEVLSLIVVLVATIRGSRTVSLDLPPRALPARREERDAA